MYKEFFLVKKFQVDYNVDRYRKDRLLETGMFYGSIEEVENYCKEKNSFLINSKEQIKLKEIENKKRELSDKISRRDLLKEKQLFDSDIQDILNAEFVKISSSIENIQKEIIYLEKSKISFKEDDLYWDFSSFNEQINLINFDFSYDENDNIIGFESLEK